MVSAAKTNQEMEALRVDYADLAPDPQNLSAHQQHQHHL